MKKKLLLIKPDNKKVCSHIISYEPHALGLIAALTPQNWDVEIIDEQFDEIDYDIFYDLVGISPTIVSINRAYEIATEFKNRGVLTIAGGHQVSFTKDEALQFFDSILIGEAEKVWLNILNDIDKSDLKPIYYGGLADADEILMPRRDLYKNPYTYGIVQTSRGCPFNCSFCSISEFNGKKIRFRSIESVVNELKTIKQQIVFFIDDNIFGAGKMDADRAISLFKAIIKSGVKKDWIACASVNIADNEDVLKYASKSGCKLLIIGIETNTKESLKEIGKSVNFSNAQDNYQSLIRKLHHYKIGVNTNLIIGFDSETREDIVGRLNSIIRFSYDISSITILTPLPGTRLYQKLLNENRILFKDYPNDWSKYDFRTIVHKPLNITVDDVQDILDTIGNSIYYDYNVPISLWKTLIRTKSLKTTLFVNKIGLKQYSHFTNSRFANNLNSFAVFFKLVKY